LKRITQEIQSEIEAIARSEALYEEANFNDRVEAIDFIEFDIIERIEGLLLAEDQVQELVALQQYAEMVKSQLEETNKNLFQKLRANIRSGHCTGAELRRQLAEYAGCNPTERGQDDIGYDSLDAFLSGLLLIEGTPGETKERQPEMVFYQPTPARIVLELIERASLKKEDVFYDLGSGLGQVSMLVNLLSGARAKGVEFEPAYCDYARRCAKELNLSQVEFINADAREVDYSDGTVFFMYTPFEGRLLQEVLEKLKGESRKRKIRVCTYGACTLQVSRQSWLKRVDQNGNPVHKLAVFESV
jgi:hypothetical protein